MELDRTAFVGVGGVLVGAVLAFAFGASGRASLEAQLRQAGDVTATVAGLETSIDALHERVAGLETQIAGVEGAVTAIEPAHQEALHGLAGRIEGLGDELSGAVSGLGARVGERLETDLSALRERLSEFGAERVAAVSEGASQAPAAAAGPGAGETIRIGAATNLADGALRIFLSGTDPAAGAARVAVNGVATTTLALGAPADIDGCALTLTGFAPGAATLDADCGSGGAATAEPEAEPQAAVAAAGPGAGAEVRVGGAASLGEGAVRVFLSAIDPAAGTARAAINGVAVTTLALGAPVAAGACDVMLTGFTPVGATIEAACDGAAATQAAAAEGAAPATAAAGGPALTPGQTGVFGDGKLRVFVSAVDAAGGAARVAVNGTEVTALRQGEPATVGDCTLTLTGAGPDGATLDATC